MALTRALVYGADYIDSPAVRYLPGVEVDFGNWRKLFTKLKYRRIPLAFNAPRDEFVKKLELLLRSAEPDDHLIVVFCGHGIRSDVLIDGQTVPAEGLFCYNGSAAPAGDSVIFDMQWRQILAAARSPHHGGKPSVPVDLTVVFDCCLSCGMLSTGDCDPPAHVASRGRFYPTGQMAPVPLQLTPPPADSVKLRYSAMYLTASLADENAFEDEAGGFFTHSIDSALAEPPEPDFRELVRRAGISVSALMSAQHPGLSQTVTAGPGEPARLGDPAFEPMT